VITHQQQQIRNIESNRQQLHIQKKEKQRIDKLTYKDKDDIYG
jgi:hypothetical protein